ncbi:hypothetical protein EG68_08410 [Paragonimus skrjabini miyazakii]|uniref:Protein Jade-1 n=1 Tax=Paragonimus skrjabini miyazakii TaxID=59628 RepID=A0A8S9YQX8_9TREM|nr:hypothetical protein EG68_08410 [Paragonimus skrjabini miyazakii]
MPRVKEVTHLLNEWKPMVLEQNDKPAELFDTHPLSEMMLSSEAESFISEFLVLIENNWRSEWHRNGVQVPVHSLDELTNASSRKVQCSKTNRHLLYTLRPAKLWHDTKDARYDVAIHCVPDEKARSLSPYHIDKLDYAWIFVVNEERECLDLPLIQDWMLEEIMETLEHITYIKMQEKIKELEVVALEFDENAKCDVCLSYEGEDGNELVFCDGCFLCVHQACYGIPRLPEGSWICRQCEAGVKSTTPCSLCPNTGGAMKMTDDGKQWCHISCALWVPEVGFGDVDLMEPVIHLANIPKARRNLLCSICRSRYGAPIQCSSKKCKVAFHVTCAFQSNLTMRQELLEKDVRLVGLCQKHSRKDQQMQQSCSPTHGSSTRGKITPIKVTNQSPNSSVIHPGGAPLTRKQRICELEETFYTLVNESELNIWLSDQSLNMRKSKGDTYKDCDSGRCTTIPEDIRSAITSYWRLKRRANFNQPLINPPPFKWRQTASKAVESTKEALDQAARAAADMQAFDAFRRIRFGLDRSRLVVDMVLQRERRKLALFRRMWRIAELQMRLVMSKQLFSLSPADLEFFSTAHLGKSVYDNMGLFKNYNCGRFLTAEAKNGNRCLPTLCSPPSVPQKSISPKEIQSSPKSRISSTTKTVMEKINIPNDVVDLNVSECIYTIPYEQLIVPEDIKQRLRSAITFVTNNVLRNGFQIEENSRRGFRGAAALRRCKRPHFASSLKKSDNPVNNRRHTDLKFTEGNLSTTSAKRSRRSNPIPTDNNLFSNHSIPVLTKFATIRLSTGTLRLV